MRPSALAALRRALPLGTLALLLPLAGCFQLHALLRLNADGSGTIEETALLSASVIEQIRAADPSADLWPLDVDSLHARARRLGPGVRFVRLDTLRTPEASGLRAVYAFDDVAALRYWFDAGALVGQSGSGLSDPSEIGSPGPNAAAPLTFERAADGAVRVRVPQPQPPAGPPPALDPAAVAAAASALHLQFETDQGAAARAQLAGARYAITLAGPLAMTDATHATDSTVTLVDVPFVAFLDLARDKPELVARAQLLRQEGYSDYRTLLAALAAGYDVRFERRGEVTLRFR